MNKVTILLILSCAAVYVAEGYDQKREREMLKQCFAQVGLDYVKMSEETKTMSEDEVLEQITPYKMGCIGICVLKKELDNKIPVRQHILDSLDKAEIQYPGSDMAEFTDKARNCIDEVKDDCALIHCLKPWDHRVADIIGL